jgi:hypothetical protein
MGNEGGSIPVETADPYFPQQLALEGQLSEQGYGPQSFEVSGPPLSQPSREGMFHYICKLSSNIHRLR